MSRYVYCENGYIIGSHTVVRKGEVLGTSELGQRVRRALIAEGLGKDSQGPAIEIKEQEAQEEEEEVTGGSESSKRETESTGGVDATPAAVKLAEEEGIDLSDVDGSGKDGRILKSDVSSHE